MSNNYENICFTDREKEVLKYVVQGLNNNEIAEELGISVHTVKVYVSSILEKLGVGSRVKAAVVALRQKMV